MGDHFVLLVDRLLTESTLGATIEGQYHLKQTMPLAMDCTAESNSSHRVDFRDPGKVVECRICQDEDEDANMETPCSCCGSLKYAHRRCIQRWCNEKGDTTCEICHQQFQPGYTAPPHVFQFKDIPMNLRENWEISRRNLNNPHFIAMVSANSDFVDSDYDDYAESTARSLVCCRLVAVIFMLLLILRHTLPLMIGGEEDLSFSPSTVMLLRTAGIVLPVYVIFTALSAMHHRRQRQEINVVSPTSNGRREQSALQHHSRIVHVG